MCVCEWGSLNSTTVTSITSLFKLEINLDMVFVLERLFTDHLIIDYLLYFFEKVERHADKDS